MGGELEDGTLTVWTGRDNTDIGWVVNGGDDAGSEDNLLPANCLSYCDLIRFFHLFLPGLANVDHVDSIWASLPEVWLHVDLEVL